MNKKIWKIVFDIAVTLVNIACVIVCGGAATNLLPL